MARLEGLHLRSTLEWFSNEVNRVTSVLARRSSASSSDIGLGAILAVYRKLSHNLEGLPAHDDLRKEGRKLDRLMSRLESTFERDKRFTIEFARDELAMDLSRLATYLEDFEENVPEELLDLLHVRSSAEELILLLRRLGEDIGEEIKFLAALDAELKKHASDFRNLALPWREEPPDYWWFRLGEEA